MTCLDIQTSTSAAADVRAAFHAPTTTLRERKQLIRAVISEIVLTVEDTRRIAEVTIIWQGGATSTGTIQMNRPGAGHNHTLPDDTAELRRIHRLRADRPSSTGHIRIDQALRDKIQSQAPDGWLPADQAAKALGLSRATVFQKVRDGQLPAIHVNNGQRRSLRIQVKPEPAGLLDTPK